MQVKCKYCESYLSDTDERCPSCGAVNDLLVRTANGAPKTIEELKEWYVAHNLPDENTTRFFIGKNVESRRAFGIYKDEQTGNFVVYKNKDTGQRMVRYEGKDEAYAVNELYQKLKIEIQNQKSRNLVTAPHHSNKRFGIRIAVFIYIVIIMICVICSIYTSRIRTKDEGYYYYENNTYYYYNSNWYKVTDASNNTWDYFGYTSPIVNQKYKKYYYENNAASDKIPDTISFKTSGYYFDSCPESYYTLNNSQVYYYYRENWYVYEKADDTTQYFFGSSTGNWERVYPSTYNDKIDLNVRKNCNDYTTNYSSDWQITDFRESSYYSPDEGYYKINGIYYYYWIGKWYLYDNGWKITSKPSGNYYDYYDSYNYDSDSVSSFSDSSYYQDYLDSRNSSSSSSERSSSYSSDDWDSDSSWSSSDSWDSSSTDWDSDW